MKFRIFCSLIVLIVSSCSINKTTEPTPTLPSGSFTGKFVYLHIHSFTGIIDTLQANLQLNIDPTTGFKITGDTATVHAGSYGSYLFGSNYNQIDFIDNTNVTPQKSHLNGVYQYIYDGTNLSMVQYSPLDTITYKYSFKKTTN